TGAAGWAHGQVTLGGVPGVSLDAALDVEVNTTSATIAVDATHSIAGPLLRLRGDGSLAIAGLATLTGSVPFQVAGTTIQVGVSGTSLAAALIVHGDGTVAGAGTANVALPVSVPGVALSGTATLQINTTGAAVTSTVVNGVTIAFADATKVVSASGSLQL